MALLTTAVQAISDALTLRLQELGHILSPSHLQAIVADVIVAINANSGTVVANAATDANYKPPPHNKF